MTKEIQRKIWNEYYGIYVYRDVNNSPKIWIVTQDKYGFCNEFNTWEEAEEQANYIVRYVKDQEKYQRQLERMFKIKNQLEELEDME